MAEGYYGEPTCPKCGGTALPAADQGGNTLPDEAEDAGHYGHGCNDYYCAPCAHWLDTSDVYSEEALGYTLDDGEYQAQDCLDSDIMIIRSPYYTYAPFCSPCVPGAGNLNDAGECFGQVKTYCFGHDWFDDGKAPYRVFRVDDNTEVFADAR